MRDGPTQTEAPTPTPVHAWPAPSHPALRGPHQWLPVGALPECQGGRRLHLPCPQRAGCQLPRRCSRGSGSCRPQSTLLAQGETLMGRLNL